MQSTSDRRNVSRPSWDLTDDPDDTGDWQELRSDLLSLLSQVEGQITPEPAQPAHAHDQHTDADGNGRHRDALASVRRAVNRFQERDNAPLPSADVEDEVAAAIRQIRSRERTAAETAPVVQSHGPDGQLGKILSTVSDRLSDIEQKLNRSAPAQETKNPGQIEAHLSQLTSAVEILANSMGENDITRRIETQISGLRDQVQLSADNETRHPAFEDFSRRLADMAGALHELKEKGLGGSSDLKEIGREQSQGMRAIEASVRNVYDRIDQIEKAVSLSPAETEKLSQQLALIAQSIEQNSGTTLLAHVEQTRQAVNELAANTANDRGVIALSKDLAALKATITEGFDERLSAIEKQLVQIGRKIGETGKKDLQLAPLETQIRQLVARMDQTGEQLDGLAELLQPASKVTPEGNFAAIAEAAASKALSRYASTESRPSKSAAPGLDSATLTALTDDLAQKIVAKLEKTAPNDKAGAELSGSRGELEAIAEKIAQKLALGFAPLLAKKEASLSAASLADIEERLQRLLKKDTAASQPVAKTPEQRPSEVGAGRVIGKLNTFPSAKPAPTSAPGPVVAKTAPVAQPATPAAAATPKMNAVSPAKIPSATQPARNEDQMPIAPNMDRDLRDPGFPDAPRATSTTEALNHASIKADTQPEPRPTPAGRSQWQVEDRPATRGPGVNRNTFIEAARKAQQRRIEEIATEPQPQSIMARALARLRDPKPKATGTAAPVAPKGKPKSAAAPKPNSPAPIQSQDENISPATPPVSRAPEGQTTPVPEQKTAKPEPRANTKNATQEAAVGPAEKRADPPAGKKVRRPKKDKSELGDGEKLNDFLSMFSRHKRPLALAASLVAVSMLGFNFVNHRTGGKLFALPAQQTLETASIAKSDYTVGDLIDPIAAGQANEQPFRPAALIDPAYTGSVDPFPKLGLMEEKAALSQPMPGAAAAQAINELENASAFAGKPDLPPEAVGPIELRQAAADGDPRAQFEVGAIYSEGKAIKADDATAYAWYQRAAMQGFAPAEYRLGALLEHGTGHEMDLQAAVGWYEKAAEAGNRMAAHNLAAIHAGGQLGTQDFAAAATWFTRAARQGLTDSQFNLGMLYARGLGVTQDLQQSYVWFALAAQSGDQDAMKARDDIGRSLDAAGRNAAQEKLANWKRQPIDFAANFAPIGTWSDHFDTGEPIKAKAVIQNVQAVLGRLGYDVGAPDGLMGPRTSEAIKDFESRTGMSESGEINARLLAVLASQPV